MLDLGSHNNQFGYHYVSADRRLCLFHALVFLFNDTDALLDRRQSVQAPKPWTVDTLLNFFFFDVLPWVEIAAPNLLAHLLSRVGLQSIEKYRFTSLTLTLMTSVSNHTRSACPSPCPFVWPLRLAPPSRHPVSAFGLSPPSALRLTPMSSPCLPPPRPLPRPRSRPSVLPLRTRPSPFVSLRPSVFPLHFSRLAQHNPHLIFELNPNPVTRTLFSHM